MYCYLYRSFERFRRAELLNAAKAGTLSYLHLPSPQELQRVVYLMDLKGSRKGEGLCRFQEAVYSKSSPSMHIPQPPGGDFLLRYARVAPPAKKCAFVLTRDGRPVKVQQTIFSECFYTMAMNELWKATGEVHYQVRGRDGHRLGWV